MAFLFVGGDTSPATTRYRTKIYRRSDGPGWSVGATDRIRDGGEMRVVAATGLEFFPHSVAQQIAAFIERNGPPPRMRFVPIPKPTCICGWPPGRHAPNCTFSMSENSDGKETVCGR